MIFCNLARFELKDLLFSRRPTHFRPCWLQIHPDPMLGFGNSATDTLNEESQNRLVILVITKTRNAPDQDRLKPGGAG